MEIASRLGTEIVNADSMQVYRYMDIGTAKPTREERSAIAHHVLDVVGPDEHFDAAFYISLARPVIDDLHSRNKVPLIVGGTGLYMKALEKGICPGAPGDARIRNELLRDMEERGLDALYDELVRVDPELARRIHSHDRQRIIRALEVHRLTGEPLSKRQQNHRFQESYYRATKLFLTRDRDEIYERIDRRVHVMVEQGLVDEVRGLLERGYGPRLKPMQSLGYKQIVRHLQGEYSLEAAIREIQGETRRYAKRQMTWFRADPEFQWIDARYVTSSVALLRS